MYSPYNVDSSSYDVTIYRVENTTNTGYSVSTHNVNNTNG